MPAGSTTSPWIAVLLVLVAIALVSHAALGTFARYWQDDYCLGAALQQHGWLGAQRESYWTITGKFSHALALVTALSIGPRLPAVLPAIVLALWWGSLCWMLSGIAQVTGRSVSRTAIAALALVLLFLVVESMRDVVHSLYWQTGLFVYAASLILVTALVGTALRWPQSRHRAAHLGLVGILAFVAGGFSETTVAAGVAGIVALTGWISLHGSRPTWQLWRPPIIASLMGALASLAVVVGAPGNAVRLALVGERAGWIEIAAATAHRTGELVVWWALLPPWTATMAVATGVYVGRRILLPAAVEPGRRTAVIVGLSAVGLVWVSILPAVWGYGPAVGPEARTYTVAGWVLTMATVTVAGLLSRDLMVDRLVKWWTATRHRQLAAALLLIAAPVWSLGRALELLPQLRAYAAAWDARDPQIRAAVEGGVKTLLVNPLPTVAGLNDVAAAPPRNWVNGCIAAYYGLERIEPMQVRD